MAFSEGLMYYQQQPWADYYFKLSGNEVWGIRTHIHNFYELYWCELGRLRIVIADTEYVLLPGEAVLIFPYQSHYYPDVQSGQGWFCTFGADMITSFASE